MRCQHCGRSIIDTAVLRCNYCHDVYCSDCWLPEKHSCQKTSLGNFVDVFRLHRFRPEKHSFQKTSLDNKEQLRNSENVASVQDDDRSIITAESQHYGNANTTKKKVTKIVGMGVLIIFLGLILYAVAGQLVLVSNPPPTIQEIKSDMLELINDERQKHGLEAVSLGTNTAAQSHAQSMLENCYVSHWGVDGMKPYMRYSQVYGYQYNTENVRGSDYCIKHGENYAKISPKLAIGGAMESFMDSPGHRDNILDPHHRKVNLGVVWDTYNMRVVQHFEYNYALFAQLPKISNDTLTFSLFAINGAEFDDPKVVIVYDPPPRELTRGQLAGTLCYFNGDTVLVILPPLPPGSHYEDDGFYQDRELCQDPYEIPPDTVTPKNAQESNDLHEKTKMFREKSTIYIPVEAADSWHSTSDGITISHDIGDLVSEYGSGVYTVLVLGNVNGDDVFITRYSVFV